MRSKIFVFLMIILFPLFVFAVNYPYVDTVLEDFDDEQSDWYINPELDYYYFGKKENKKLRFEISSMIENTLAVSRDFSDKKYTIGDNTTFSYCASYQNYSEASIIITTFENFDYQKNDYESKTFKLKSSPEGNFIRLYDHFDYKKEILPGHWTTYVSVKKIEIWIDRLEKDLLLDDLALNHVYMRNPKYTDVCEAQIYSRPSKVTVDDTIDINLLFYYGYESQLVDIYMLMINDSGVYFFPDWTQDAYCITLYFEQYINFPDETYITSYDVRNIPLVVGDNSLYIGIMPHDTFEILNELHSTTIKLIE